MRVKVEQNEVSWLFGDTLNKGDAANSAVAEKLGADAKFFVPMKTGHGFYSWELPGNDWRMLTQAMPDEKQAVNEAYDSLLNSINKRFGATPFITSVTTVPNKDYVYFRYNEAGAVDVLIVCWGFKNQKSSVGGPIKKVVQKVRTQHVRIAFQYDGELLPGREFLSSSSLQKVPNLFTTFSDGYYSFSDGLKVGETMEFVDKASGCRFTKTVVEGEDTFIFDVTRYCSLKVVVTRDGELLSNAVADVEYGGKNFTVVTAEDGEGVLSLPYHDGRELSVTVEGDCKVEPVAPGENLFEYAFVTPVTHVPLAVTVFSDGCPLAGTEIRVTAPCGSAEYYTDGSGVCNCEIEYKENAYVEVCVNGLVQNQVISTQGNSFSFEFSVPKPRTVRVVVEGINGENLKGGNVVVSQGSTTLCFELDDESALEFERTVFDNDKEITVSVDLDNGLNADIPFVLEEDEDEYLLAGELLLKKSRLWMLELALYGALLAGAYFAAPCFIELARHVGNCI